MANAVASPALEAVVSGDITSSTAKLFDRKKNAGKLHQEELNDGSMMSEDDLMEMGGDPFFLVNDNDDDDEKAKKEKNKKKVDLEEEEKWEWDGEPIEGSHDDEFEPRQFDKDSVPFLPSIGFMSMANSISSPALDAVVSSSSSRAPPTPAAMAFDRNKNSGILHQIFMEKEEAARMEGFVVSGDDLMEMGGDPSFLAEDDNDNGGYEKMNLDGGWDGTVDEDAHLEG